MSIEESWLVIVSENFYFFYTYLYYHIIFGNIKPMLAGLVGCLVPIVIGLILF